MAQPFDDTAKTYYRRFFEKHGALAISQYEVFSRSRTIDLVVECTEVDRSTFADTVFEHLRRLNALEFKGYYDPLTTVDLNRIRMRAWGLGAVDNTKRKVSDVPSNTVGMTAQEIADMPSQRTVTIVCVTRPEKVLDTLKHEFHFEPTDQQGVYCNYTREIPVWIIHPTELALEPRNYPLLPLARGQKLEEFVELCLREGLTEYLQLTLDVGLVAEPDVIWRKIMEVYGMELTVHEDTWPYIDEFFRRVPDAIGKVSTLQEALAESQRKGTLIGQRRMLLRQLRHKFGKVPEYVVRQIEATDESEQIDQWMDQIWDVDSLDKMTFKPEESSSDTNSMPKLNTP